MVVHFAAETHVDRLLIIRPFIQTNVVGTPGIVGGSTFSKGKTFHHVSTDDSIWIA